MFDEKLYRQNIKDFYRDYNDKNREKIKQKRKLLYHENKKEIIKYRTEKVQCECGVIICRGSLTVHRKTKKHQKLLLQKVK